ncbi:protein phosphatase Mn(2+)-dependent 1K-like isoform X2 [Amphiura filiformis]|uniref:protein phosphatase Mn(2+)-dependent 1K-like isoform X2 n=1 Tax=Amphiura filiformis TaxID=82378 RepID=UPI003B21A145
MACRTALGILTRRLSSNYLRNNSSALAVQTCKCTVAVRHSSTRREDWDSFGSWDERIYEPILLEQSIKHGIPIPKVSLENVGTASLQGRRSVNEDRIIIQELQPNLLLFGLFDGHAGALAADFTVEHLCDLIQTEIKGEHDLQKVLSKAFVEVNKMLAWHVAELKDPKIANTGTTATVCLLRNGNELVVANVGDSRALVCRKAKAVRLSCDHEPEYNTQEKARIKRCGGIISWNSLGKPLVNGVLTMTRSIGDLPLKKFGVTAEPETRSLEIKHTKDGFLVMVTDGVHFVMNDQEICDSVISCHSPQEAADFVVDHALQFGSDDNVSAIVIPLGQWGRFTNPNMMISLRWHRVEP